MAIRTSEIPFQAASLSDEDTVIILAEVSPDNFRLRRIPVAATGGGGGGTVGPAGPTGPAGDAGATGATGATGAQGAQGNIGPQGNPGTNGTNAAFQLGAAASDETTPLTTGVAKLTFRMPSAATNVTVRATLTTASSSGVVTVDINENGASILSTKITVDANEKTSTTAAIPPVVADPNLADDAEITVDIDTAGTGATGLKIWILGQFV